MKKIPARKRLMSNTYEIRFKIVYVSCTGIDIREKSSVYAVEQVCSDCSELSNALGLEKLFIWQ